MKSQHEANEEKTPFDKKAATTEAKLLSNVGCSYTSASEDNDIVIVSGY